MVNSSKFSLDSRELSFDYNQLFLSIPIKILFHFLKRSYYLLENSSESFLEKTLSYYTLK